MVNSMKLEILLTTKPDKELMNKSEPITLMMVEIKSKLTLSKVLKEEESMTTKKKSEKSQKKSKKKPKKKSKEDKMMKSILTTKL